MEKEGVQRDEVLRRLKIATALCFSFLIVEAVGGYMAGSLAIMSDAAHLFADMAGFAVAIAASHLASLPVTEQHTFGLKRSESLAALLSMVSLAFASIGLAYAAIQRLLFGMEDDIDAKLMTGIAAIGVVVNFILAYVLGEDHIHLPGAHDHDHSHDHGDGHGHGHSCSSGAACSSVRRRDGAKYAHVDSSESLGADEKSQPQMNGDIEGACDTDESHSHDHDHDNDRGCSHEHHDHTHGHGDDTSHDASHEHSHIYNHIHSQSNRLKKSGPNQFNMCCPSQSGCNNMKMDNLLFCIPTAPANYQTNDGGIATDGEDTDSEPDTDVQISLRESNVNLSAAYLHVLGDLAQSVAVLVGGLIVWWKPSWQMLDPIITLVFSVFVMASTVKVLRSSVAVLLEETPANISWKQVFTAISEIDGVSNVHELHIWSISHGEPALTVHCLSTNPNAIAEINKVCRRFGIDHVTIQVQPEGFDCLTCKDKPDGLNVVHNDSICSSGAREVC